MIYNEIQRKQKPVDPEKFNMRIVEDSLAEVEAMQFILAMIIDEENRRRNGQSEPVGRESAAAIRRININMEQSMLQPAVDLNP